MKLERNPYTDLFLMTSKNFGDYATKSGNTHELNQVKKLIDRIAQNETFATIEGCIRELVQDPKMLRAFKKLSETLPNFKEKRAVTATRLFEQKFQQLQASLEGNR